MRNNYFLKSVLFGATMVVAGLGSSLKAQFPSPYCAVTFTNGTEPITLVKFANINQTSPAATGGANLVDYTAVVGAVSAGQSYSITVNGNSDGSYTNHYGVYIDYNKNNVFDTDEYTYIGSILGSTGLDPATQISKNIAIPITALAGSTRMRVIKKFNSIAEACQTGSGYGQAQDYTLDVTEATACTGTPSVGTASSSVSSVCLGVSFVLNSTATPAGNLSYQWQSSTDQGVTWSDLGSASASSEYTVTSQAVATSYRLKLTCTSSGETVTSNVVNVGQNAVNECYCMSAIDLNCADGDVIKNVTFGAINNNSECGDETTGYSNYTTLAPAVISKGGSYPISVFVGPSGDGWLDESVGVWIDFNHNGVFDESEYLYVGTGLDQALTNTIVVPANAVVGDTRMRVVVAASIAEAFNSAYSCGPLDPNNNFGEMEDYTVTINDNLAVSDIAVASTVVYPNPVKDVLKISTAKASQFAFVIHNAAGQVVKQGKTASQSIEVNSLPKGVYILTLTDDKGTTTHKIIKD